MLHSSNIVNDAAIQNKSFSRRNLKRSRNAIDLEMAMNSAGFTFSLLKLFVKIEMF